MFSKFLNSARNILKPVNSATAEMVTTRGSIAKAASASEETPSDDGDTIVVQMPATSPRKRRRVTKKVESVSLLSEDEASATKKRKLPVRTKDDEEPHHTHSHVVVEIPVSQVTPGSAARSKQVVEETAMEVRAVAEIQDSDLDEEELASHIKLKTPTSAKKSPGKEKLSKEAIGKSEGVGTDVAKPKHKRFGSADPEVELPAQTSKAEPIEVESDTNDSDDDAPEEVVAQDAAEDAKKSIRDAARALEEQESAIRKKRKERDAFLKQQAEIASKKRKRGNLGERLKSPTEADVMLAEALLSPKKSENEVVKNDISDFDQAIGEKLEGPNDAGEDGSDNPPAVNIEQEILDDSPTDDGPVDEADPVLIPSKSISTDQTILPDLLPIEYLEDDDVQDAGIADQEEPRQKAKKTKFSNLVDKKPKDLRKGSTTFRVVGKQNTFLAPKASSHARSTKESWLQGRPGRNGQTNRKPFSSGFFVSKK